MKKYAVETNSKDTKTASVEDVVRCPECDSLILLDANVPTCPIHGTKYLEEKE